MKNTHRGRIMSPVDIFSFDVNQTLLKLLDVMILVGLKYVPG